MQQGIPAVPAVILGKILLHPQTGECCIHKHVRRTLQPGSCRCKAFDSPG